MGTTVQSITGSGRALPEASVGQAANGAYYGSQRPGNWQQASQHGIESPESVFSPQNQSGAPPYNQNQAQHSSYEAQQAAAAAAHQQQQRGVSQLTNAVAVASTLGHPPRNAQTPTPQSGMNGTGSQPGLEKRGPVEFNHAISYVNKIKVCLIDTSKFQSTNSFSSPRRIAFKTSQKFTSSFWKSFKRTSANQSPSRTSTLKSLTFSTLLPTFLRILNNFCRNPQLKQKLPHKRLLKKLYLQLQTKRHSRFMVPEVKQRCLQSAISLYLPAQARTTKNANGTLRRLLLGHR